MRIRLGEQDRNVIKNITGAFFVKGGSLAISVLLLPAYIDFFDNQVILGVWYTMLSILNWINLFDLGLGNGLRNRLPGFIENKEYSLARQYVSTTYIVMALLSIGICFTGLVVIPLLNWNTILNVSTDVITEGQLVSCVIIVFLGIVLHLAIKIVTSILYAIQKSAVVNLLSLLSNATVLLLVLTIPSLDLVNNLRNMAIINAVALNIPYIICTICLFSKPLKELIPSARFFNRKLIRDILNVGLTLLWLTLVFMVISSTNELLVTYLTSPDNVVEYQAYSKIFHTGAMLLTLALTPIWSAVTKAQAKGDYCWIRKIYKIFLLASGACFFVELCVIPLLQWLFDVWLGKGLIVANSGYALSFAILGTVMILHNVNTSIGNGMSYFRVQIIWMTVAAILFIPMSFMLVNVVGSWIGVVWSAVICLIPYEIIAPYYTFREINRHIKSV